MLNNDGTQAAPIWQQQSYTNAFGDTAFAANGKLFDGTENKDDQLTQDQQDAVDWAMDGYKSVITGGGVEFEKFATALDGKTAAERTVQERTLLDEILSSVLEEMNLVEGNLASSAAHANAVEKFVMPTVLGAVNGDVEPGLSGTVLPWGIAGAYSETSNTILMSRETPEEFLDDVAAEELGEAIAAHAAANGITLQGGDVGNRLANVLTGKAVDAGRVSGEVVIDGKIETANFASAGDETGIADKTLGELAEEWGVDLLEANNIVGILRDLQGGWPWTAQSFPDVEGWTDVIAIYGKNDSMTTYDMGHAAADDVLTFAFGVPVNGKSAIVTEVHPGNMPSSNVHEEASLPSDEQLAKEWNADRAAVSWARNVANDHFDRKGVTYLLKNDIDDVGWNRLVAVYGNGERLTVDEYARAIVDGAVQTAESGTIQHAFSHVDLNQISSLSLTDGLWRFIEDTFSNGSDRTQVSVQMFDEATDRVMGDTQAFTGEDYDAFIDHFADVKLGGVRNRFSKDAILAIFTTNAIELGDNTGDDFVGFNSTISEHHHHSFFETVLNKLEQWGINVFIGLIAHITGLPPEEIADTMGKIKDWTVEHEEKLEEIILAVTEYAIGNDSALALTLNYIKQGLDDNPGMDAHAIAFVDTLVSKVETNKDPIALAVLLRAVMKPESESAEFLNGMAANNFLLNDMTVGDEFAAAFAQMVPTMLGSMWQGDEAPDVSGLGIDAGAQRALAQPAAAGAIWNLPDDKFADYLGERDGDARFDFALEVIEDFNSIFATIVDPGASLDGHTMNNFQERVFWTYPRPQEDGRYYSEVRVRLFDEVGMTGSGKVPNTNVGVSASAGMQNYHDLVIPITFESDYSDAKVGELKWKNTYNVIGEGDITAGDTAIGQAAAAWNESVGFMDWANMTDNLIVKGVAVGAAAIGKLGATAVESADIEQGFGAGLGFTYNLGKIKEEHPNLLWSAPLLWGIGAAAGGWLGATYLGPLLEAAGMPVTGELTGIHAGADLGWLAGDFITEGIADSLDPELAEMNGGVFEWTAARPIKVGNSAASLRARFQHNEEIMWDAEAAGF